eukprot:10727461-Karenia_brevis.AAC.1
MNSVTLGPKPGYRPGIDDVLIQILSRTVLFQVGCQVKRKLGALDCALFGRELRGALVALSARQYDEKQVDISDTLADALHYVQ